MSGGKFQGGVHIKQASNSVWGNGFRLYSASSDANYWDSMIGSSNQLIFAYQNSQILTMYANGDVEVQNGGLIVDKMTTAQRDSRTRSTGTIVFNTTTGKFQGKTSAGWVDFH
jgi:hypothetical protein